MSKPRTKAHRRSDDPVPPAASATALTPERAASFIKLLHAGLPAVEAIGYILPAAENLDPKQLATIAQTWANSELTLAASVAFTRGPWEELEPEQRLILSRDKWLAENARYLYSRNFTTISQDEVGKAKYAYDVITDYLKGSSRIDDPVAAFLSRMQDQFEKTQAQQPVTVDADVLELPPH